MQQFFGDEFDLWSYEFLRDNAVRLLDRLNLDMPTPETGGLWPQEWIDLFRRWTVSGFKRLQLGTAEYEVVRKDDLVELLASGTFPAGGYIGCLQLEAVTDAARSYVLYFESPDTPAADPRRVVLQRRAVGRPGDAAVGLRARRHGHHEARRAGAS